MDTATGYRPEEDVKKGPLGLAFIGLALATCELVAFGRSIERSNPPRFDNSWPIAWGTSIVAILLALIASSLRKSLANQTVCFLAIGIALLGSWGPTASYQGNYGDYPWLVLIALGLLSTVGAFLCRLKALAILNTIFLGIWLVTAFLPGRSPFPMTQRVGDLECKVIAVDWEGRPEVRFQLRDLKGRELATLIDPENVTLEGSVGPFIDVDGFPGHSTNTDDMFNPPKGSKWTYAGNVFPPRWVSSFDLRIVVRRWPEKPTAEVTIPLQTLPKQPLTSRAQGYTLSVSSLAWGQTQTTMPVLPCLQAEVFFSGNSYSGTAGNELRAIDEWGHPLQTQSASVSGGPEEATESLEILGVDRKAKFIRLQFFGEGARQDSVATFNFGRVTNRP